MHQHILRNSLQQQQKEQMGQFDYYQQLGTDRLLTLSKKEPCTIGVRVLVRHLMNHFRKSRRPTEKLDQKIKIVKHHRIISTQQIK